MPQEYPSPWPDGMTEKMPFWEIAGGRWEAYTKVLYVTTRKDQKALFYANQVVPEFFALTAVRFVPAQSSIDVAIVTIAIDGKIYFSAPSSCLDIWCELAHLRLNSSAQADTPGICGVLYLRGLEYRIQP